MNKMNRRKFLGVCGLGAAASLGGLSLAEATILPKPKEAESFDVVVIGAGLAGLSAACQAAELGAKVAVLEKVGEDKTGGNSALAGGTVVMPGSEDQKDKDFYYNALKDKSLSRGNNEIIRAIADDVVRDMMWLRGLGVGFTDPAKQAGYPGNTAVFLPGAYRGVPVALKKIREVIAEKGGKFFHETKAQQLVLDENGSVVGVRAMTKSGMKDFIGKSVVIATGGYAANKEILETFVDQDADEMMVRGDKKATGDGLFLGKEAGASWIGMGGMAGMHVAAVSPLNTAAGNPTNRALFFCLGINREGKRYVDESRGYVANGKASMKQPGQTIALIYDEALKKQNGVMFAVNLFSNLGIEILEADSLEALAEKIQVPPDALKKTVSEFNDAVEDGNTAPKANPPKMQHAYKIETSKFYALYPLVPGIALTFGGLKIDDKGRVLQADGTVIPGLYAAGEGAGAPFYEDYVGGASLANCLVMGRRAGNSAAGK